jgi:hypothetical protein
MKVESAWNWPWCDKMKQKTSTYAKEIKKHPVLLGKDSFQ